MDKMILTEENYFSEEAEKMYMGQSQYKNYVGTMGIQGCEAKAFAKSKGIWKEEVTPAMLIGSYTDAHFEGTLATFKAKNPEIYTKKGDRLLANYAHANKIIERAERDEYFMKTMSGKKQVIMQAELFGTLWKIKIDSFHEDTAIVDLKTCASITKAFWVKDVGKVSFIDFWGYEIQGAIYQKVVEIVTGKKLPFYIAAISKEKPEPNIEVIYIQQNKLDDALSLIETNMPRVLRIKNGEEQPDRCGMCDYCKSTKVLTEPIDSDSIQLEV